MKRKRGPYKKWLTDGNIPTRTRRARNDRELVCVAEKKRKCRDRKVVQQSTGNSGCCQVENASVELLQHQNLDRSLPQLQDRFSNDSDDDHIMQLSHSSACAEQVESGDESDEVQTESGCMSQLRNSCQVFEPLSPTLPQHQSLDGEIITPQEGFLDQPLEIVGPSTSATQESWERVEDGLEDRALRVENGVEDREHLEEQQNLCNEEEYEETSHDQVLEIAGPSTFSWERIEDDGFEDREQQEQQNQYDEEDYFILQLSEIDDDEEQERDNENKSSQSESESEDEVLAETSDFNLSVHHRIMMLLLLATKKRHKLTYTGAEDLMELSGVLSTEDEPFLPTRHTMKKTIDEFSFSLSEHHMCWHCDKYVGIVTTESFHCKNPNCLKELNTEKNRKNGNFFLYLSLRDQLKALFETTLSEDNFINPIDREKIHQYNYEDIFDGRMYKFREGYISFNFFVDGVQVATTCKNSAWPVLLTINELPMHLRRKYVVMVSLWLSKKKPDCNEYLKPFVKECIELERDGFMYKKCGVVTIVRVKPFCCISDSIARPLLRNSSQFNGLNGCGFCYHPGIKMRKGRGSVRSYTLRDGSYPLRTHDDLMSDAVRAEQLGTRQRGIKGTSILSALPDFDMVHSIDLDLFHALVNVAKRFTSLWFDKSYSAEPYSIRTKLSEVNCRLLSIKPTSDVSRAPRSLEEKSDYRGHEWFFWVEAYSVPCLKNLLPPKYLNHWAHLVYGIALVMQNSVSKCDLAYAERHLHQFISGIDDLYGSQNVTFSAHLLTHLGTSVKNFSQPWAHSAFIYESFNNEIKNCVKSSNGVALQICKEMQLKVALKRMEEDLSDYLTASQKLFLKKMSESTKKLAAPHHSIGPASFFGKPKTCTLPPASVRAIVRFGGECDSNTVVSVYDRCSVSGVLYQSTNYSKVWKQNNSLALLQSNEVFLIESFVVVSSCCYVLGYFYEQKRNQKLCDVQLPHLRVLKSDHEGTLRCIDSNELLSKLLSIQVQVSPTETLNVGYINVLHMEMLT